MVASQRRTQWDYEWGEGNSGKDMGHGVLCAFLGDGSNRGYAEKLAVESLTRPGQSDPNGTQSMKHALMNRRYAYFNELRYDGRSGMRYFNDGELKELCEQQGTKIKTRTLYQEPESWQPMCGIVGTGQLPLPFTAEQCKDTGTRSRIVQSKMPRTFSLEEDKDLKEQVAEGICNAELFYLAQTLSVASSSGSGNDGTSGRKRAGEDQELARELHHSGRR